MTNHELVKVLSKGESLQDSFDLRGRSGVVALVGAGGKTSLMYALAHEIVGEGKSVVTTTTTKIFPPTKNQSPCLVLLEDDPDLRTCTDCLAEFQHVTVAVSRISGMGKLQGVDRQIVSRLSYLADYVLVEADGAAGRPVKAPAEWEPVIPPSTTLVVPLVGLDSLGKPATEQWVFRLERFCSVTGLKPGESITPQALGRLLCHPQGSLKDAPARAGVVPFLNKLDLLKNHRAIDDIVSMIGVFAGGRIRKLVTGAVGKAERSRLV